MTSETDAAQAALAELRAFEERNSRDGLFLRYCRGRVRTFLGRQSATVVGALALAAFHTPGFAVAAVALALAGEAVDCLTLRGILARHPTPPVPAAARRLATVTAAFQALTIAACVVLGWALVPYADSRLFAAAFLIGTAINAGVVRPFHRASTDARLLVYGLTLVGLVAHDLVVAPPDLPLSPGQGFFLTGTVMMAFVCITFITHVALTHRTRSRFEHDLLKEKHELARARAELVARMQETRRLAAIAQHSNDSVSIVDMDGRVQWVNPMLSRLTGYPPEDVIGQRLEDLLYSPDMDPALLAELKHARRAGLPARAEVRVVTKQGAERWFDSGRTPMYDDDGSYLGSLVVDREITETKAREAELEDARARAEAAAEAKSSFLAAMSHEIRTPMNGVIATAELLADTDLTAEQRQYTTTIVESGHALLTIINDVLDLSRLQSAAPVLHAAPFDICEVVRGVVDLLCPEARRKGIAVDLHCPAAPPPMMGDAGRLRQILINLVGNAVKFTDRGRVTVAGQAARAARGHWTLDITVTDTGIGIAADRLDSIFDSFTQADTAISRRFGGTGLGLTISRLLARQMGGDITVTSAEGAGSCFRLTLTLPEAPATALPPPRGAATRGADAVPPAGASADAPEKAPVPATASAPANGTVTILVAEDNRTNAFIVERMLDAPGRTLHFAGDGREALEMIARLRPDIVFMDVSMPELDGLAATRALRAAEAEDPARGHCPVIALTANALAEDRVACLDAGCDDYLNKPVRRDALLAMLARHARGSPAEPHDPPGTARSA